MTLRPACWLALSAILLGQEAAVAQTVTHRGFVEGRLTGFPQIAANDRRRLVGDVLAREDVFVRATDWLRLSGGLEARANSYDQVDRAWWPRLDDRTRRRPALAVRRASAAVSRGPWALEVGKQFIRWGKTDILTPTDRFAPRDYLTVIENEFLAVRGARAVVAAGAETLELVVVPWFTPSRVPLPGQRWTVVPDGLTVLDAPPADALPRRTQVGVRWAHVGAGFEFAVAVFDGLNHLPNISVPSLSGGTSPGTADPATPDPAAPGTVVLTRSYPHMRMYGGDAALPTPWAVLKGETAYYTSSTAGTDDFVLYVVQLERQIGEWLLIGGYAGSVVTRSGGGVTFAPDRGTARSIVGRAAYTIDSTRSAAIEAALRQTGDGVYVKGEYSISSGAHWRTTVAGVLIRGDADDFLGQFRRNSNLSVAFRYSF